MPRPISIAAALAAAAAIAAPAHAARVELTLDHGSSMIPAAVKMKDGQFALQAPYSGLKFKAVAYNDQGAAVLKPDGYSAAATVDLIARTPSGDKVVTSQTIYDTQVLQFSTQYLSEGTTYFARLNPSPLGGVAAATDSNAIPVRAYLKNLPGGYYSRLRNTIRFSGFYSRGGTVKARGAVKLLVQRKTGRSWRTLRTVTPRANNSWDVTVGAGRAPAAFRLRTVPVAPRRFIAVTDYKFCVATTAAVRNRMCKAIGWDPQMR